MPGCVTSAPPPGSEIEALLGGRVYLDLHVKVLKDWQRDPDSSAGSGSGVLGPYRRVLAVPGGAAFSLAGFVARLPISMQTLGIVLLVAASRGSYGLAGGVSATFLVAGAAAAPVLGRLVDRLGQARVLFGTLAVHTVGLLGLVVLALADAPAWPLFPAAVVAGGSYAQPGSLVRARWSHVLAGTPLLPTAFSWESVVDEVIFVVGPVLVTVLATGVAPAAGLLTAYGFTLVGCVALAVQRRTQPPPHPVAAGAGAAAGAAPARGAGAGRRRRRARLDLRLGRGGHRRVHRRARASRPRPGWCSRCSPAAACSPASGTARCAWRAPVHRRFVSASCCWPWRRCRCRWRRTWRSLAVLVFVGGFAISPALIAGFALLDRLVPQRLRTEGLAWFSTGIGVGLAVSSSVAGQVVDAAGGRAALGVTVAAGVLSAVRSCSAPAGSARGRQPGRHRVSRQQPQRPRRLGSRRGSRRRGAAGGTAGWETGR